MEIIRDSLVRIISMINNGIADSEGEPIDIDNLFISNIDKTIIIKPVIQESLIGLTNIIDLLGKPEIKDIESEYISYVCFTYDKDEFTLLNMDLSEFILADKITDNITNTVNLDNFDNTNAWILYQL